ncbi:ABC transporter permease [Butyrivibrio sp. NC3005]|uniref:ABC transporter permease n=1 Tax=Butyrivibrio sp. NC3005 TaxID=1280685 RepID=UPI00040E10EC|nr:ABC transporter permease [Butyrivibrio sp. NC3005]
MELKRTINNKSFVFCITTVILSFLLGYFLLVGVDKIDNVTKQQLIFSIYTVLTQFGRMIFPFIVIYSFSVDYKEKNILIYKNLGINATQYFLLKLSSMLLWFTVGILLITSAISLLYSDFSLFGVSFMYFENVMIYIIIISSIIGFSFKNMIVAFGINLLLWVFSIITLTVNPRIYFMAYYDATNFLYLDFEKYLSSANSDLLHIETSVLYNAVAFIISLIIVKMTSKKWLSFGV